MGFDADMRKVTERYKKWAETAIITNDDFAAIDSLIQRHYDDRGRLFDELQNALKRDTDIQSPWDNLCDKGLDLTERLNNEISRKIPDGFRGLGMSDFYEGEKTAWQNCKGGRIGLITEAMFEIGRNDVEIYKKLEEDLKRAREDAKVIDEVSRTTFAGFSEKVREVAAEIGSILVSAAAIALPQIPKALVPKARRMTETLIKGSSTVRELTKKKRAIKEILARNSELVSNAKAKIGDGAVRDIQKRAEELAMSWKDAERGDYDAQDWEAFGRACVEVLKNKAEPIVEKARILFDNMHPMYLEALKTSFITLFSDPSTLENFRGQLNNEMQKLLEQYTAQELQIASLRDSEPKRSANAEVQQMIKEINEALAELRNAIREIDEQMKI
ncbi:MAG TPA: hypothetical protein VFS13_00080 [Steroidobacteraceae bacterium]|nr:hypothetical protein [Steroidobacteraceae bacterium]